MVHNYIWIDSSLSMSGVSKKKFMISNFIRLSKTQNIVNGTWNDMLILIIKLILGGKTDRNSDPFIAHCYIFLSACYFIPHCYIVTLNY